MQDIKNIEQRKRQTYVQPNVKVIELSEHNVICTSPGGDTEDLGGSPFTNW